MYGKNSTDGINRFWYATNGCTYFHSSGTGTEGFVFRNTAQTDVVTINDLGNINVSGSISTNQFSTSTNNQIVLKNINIFPALVGSGGSGPLSSKKLEDRKKSQKNR